MAAAFSICMRMGDKCSQKLGNGSLSKIICYFETFGFCGECILMHLIMMDFETFGERRGVRQGNTWEERLNFFGKILNWSVFHTLIT